MSLGERLRAARKHKGWTQQELGRRLGISASAVGMYEQNRRQPDVDTLQRLCAVCGVSADYLVGGREGGPKRSVQALIDTLRGELLDAQGLMFNGEPLTPEDIRQVGDAIELAVRLTLEKPGGKAGD